MTMGRSSTPFSSELLLGLCGEKGCQNGELTIHGTGQSLVVKANTSKATPVESESFVEALTPKVAPAVATIGAAAVILLFAIKVKKSHGKTNNEHSTAQRNTACRNQTTDKAEDAMEGKNLEFNVMDSDDSSLSMGSSSSKSASSEPKDRSDVVPSQPPIAHPISRNVTDPDESSSDVPSLVSESTSQQQEIMPVANIIDTLPVGSIQSVSQQVNEWANQFQEQLSIGRKEAVRYAMNRMETLEREILARQREARQYLFHNDQREKASAQSERQHSESLKAQNQDKNWRAKIKGAQSKRHDSIKKGLMFGMGGLLVFTLMYDLHSLNVEVTHFREDPLGWMLSMLTPGMQGYASSLESSWGYVQDLYFGFLGLSDAIARISTVVASVLQIVALLLTACLLPSCWRMSSEFMSLCILVLLTVRFGIECLLAIVMANAIVCFVSHYKTRETFAKCESKLSQSGEENPQSIDVNNEVKSLNQTHNYFFWVCFFTSSFAWGAFLFFAVSTN